MRTSTLLRRPIGELEKLLVKIAIKNNVDDSDAMIRQLGAKLPEEVRFRDLCDMEEKLFELAAPLETEELHDDYTTGRSESVTAGFNPRVMDAIEQRIDLDPGFELFPGGFRDRRPGKVSQPLQ